MCHVQNGTANLQIAERLDTGSSRHRNHQGINPRPVPAHEKLGLTGDIQYTVMLYGNASSWFWVSRDKVLLCSSAWSSLRHASASHTMFKASEKTDPMHGSREALTAQFQRKEELRTKGQRAYLTVLYPCVQRATEAKDSSERNPTQSIKCI